MQAKVVSLDNQPAGDIELAEEVFGLPERADILHRVVLWQLAKRQRGTHKAKTYGEVTGSTRKIVRQKGSGGARHGGIRAPQFRKGGKAHGPVVRSHAHDLPKKVRKLGLKTALSVKLKDGKLFVIDQAKLAEGKTAALKKQLDAFGFRNALLIDGPELDANFVRAAANLPAVHVLPQQGANVYDILRRDALFLTRAAVEALEARLK